MELVGCNWRENGGELLLEWECPDNWSPTVALVTSRPCVPVHPPGTLQPDPQWRGLRVGLLVLRRLIDLFAPSEAMVVCQSFAFGAENEDRWREGTVKLRRCVRRLGFRRLRRSRFYGLSTCNVIPTAEEEALQ